MSVSVSVTTRRLTTAAAVAAAVVGAVALPASAADHHQRPSDRDRVVISDVQHVSPAREDRSRHSLNREWVEVTNNSRRGVDLDGWTLSDEEGHSYTFRYVRLAGRATVRVHTGIGRDSATDLYQDRRNHVWDENSDTATLRDDHGRFVDAFSWGRDHHRHDSDRWGGERREGGRGWDGHRDGRRDGDREEGHHHGDHHHGDHRR
ncbi:lamin tail domain-containing protein [Streptomyces sp. NPDC020298]|uniref:lamin tail domain-containing protein n=1 Tax=unclassified Streptomyces TaxID=2593676 RepID=UPI0033CDFEC0